MDIGPSTDAELLQRALEGEEVTEPGILELVAVLHAVTSMQEALAPRAGFVADLRTHLLELDLTSADAAPGDAPTEVASEPPSQSPDAKGPADGSPSVVRIASRRLRHLVAAAAAVVLLAGGTGLLSRQAVPGDLLFPVKQLLDRAAVELAGSRADEGLTHLAQAQQHISEARELIDRGDPSADDLIVALDSASDSTRAARALLLEAYRVDQRADALTGLGDFYAKALPQVDALRSDVPADAVPAWERLRALLLQGQLDTLREIATCSICGDRAAAAERQLDVLLADTSATPLPDASLQTDPTAGAPATTTAPGLPGASVSLPGATIGSAQVGLPSVGITSIGVNGGGGGVTLPSATVHLPTLGVSSTVVVGGGGATLPGATLTGPTLSATVPTVPLP